MKGTRALGDGLRRWPSRRWFVAAAVATCTVLIIAIPTDLIDTPLFQREIRPKWWSWPSLLISALLAGLVTATYVAAKDGALPTKDPGGRFGLAGAMVTFFAVGCPVCNKLVLLAIGYTGAIQFFEPAQPYLAVGSIVLLGWAFVVRVRREESCVVTP